MCINALCAREVPKVWACKADRIGHFSYLKEKSSFIPAIPKVLDLQFCHCVCTKIGDSDYSFVSVSVNRSDHHAYGFHGVEASSVVRPEDAILELVAIHTTRVPHAIKVGLTTCIVPPATFMEVSTVSCKKGRYCMSKTVCALDLKNDFYVTTSHQWSTNKSKFNNNLRRHPCLDPAW